MAIVNESPCLTVAGALIDTMVWGWVEVAVGIGVEVAVGVGVVPGSVDVALGVAAGVVLAVVLGVLLGVGVAVALDWPAVVGVATTLGGGVGVEVGELWLHPSVTTAITTLAIMSIPVSNGVFVVILIWFA
jgi:hypothetical protein